MNTEIALMPNPIALLTSAALVPGWRWRSRDGTMHDPTQMETRHLFHTLRMIWNNWMPRHMHVGKRIQYYRFQPKFYPDSYMAEAIIHCWNELQQRDDLTRQWQHEIDEMRSWFTTKLQETMARPLELEAPSDD